MTEVVVESEFDEWTLLVQQCTWESDGVMSLRLVAPDGGELPEWEPGAHLDLILPSGLVRQFSLCGPPDDRHGYTIAVLREPQSRGGSREIHESALLGRTILVRGPRNHFRLVEAERYLLIAGGIGVTPILAMARRLAGEGRPFRFLYGGRSRSTMAFLDAVPEGTEILAEDEVGLPDLDAVLDAAQPGTHVYCCGPEGLLRAVESRCADRGLTYHFERFASGKGAAAETVAVPGDSFKVELRRTGVMVDVPPDRSILDVVREHTQALSSCEEGFCGTCETRVLEGEPDHRDTVLSPDERAANQTMMICVSRACSPVLVLDL